MKHEVYQSPGSFGSGSDDVVCLAGTPLFTLVSAQILVSSTGEQVQFGIPLAPPYSTRRYKYLFAGEEDDEFNDTETSAPTS